MSKVIHIEGLCAIMLVVALWILPGCRENQQSQSKPATVTMEDVKKETKEAPRAVKAYSKEQMQAYMGQTEDSPSGYAKDISYELTY